MNVWYIYQTPLTAIVRYERGLVDYDGFSMYYI